ncbi:hypothetical protein I5M27_15235 [Adhaeribacter sp. BT258]|uniref:Uncharacterized protein n=1 Tax=Adhaeribacter terrigena TaxID=2793070 RepID=A0ABS1C4M0_9BACT|nr:hypothetical protein [Adhaeribacter terrigena]MBK0404350.1 hypothetical protein [Adhaeribacter terrigena]
MKAFYLFSLLFMLAFTPGFSQGNGSEASKTESPNHDPQKLEASLSPAEQAERDLLVPRKYQEQLAVEASKPVKYGPSNSSSKKYYSKKKYSSRRYPAKKRSTRRR